MSPVSIANFKDRFDFHCRIARQGGNANRRAGVAALFPKKINEQFRSTVDDQWDVMETRGHVDEAVHAYTANYPGHIAINGVTQRCQQVQCTRLGGELAGFQIELRADLAGVKDFAVALADLPGQEELVV